jgi:hypothetical protein
LLPGHAARSRGLDALLLGGEGLPLARDRADGRRLLGRDDTTQTIDVQMVDLPCRPCKPNYLPSSETRVNAGIR